MRDRLGKFLLDMARCIPEEVCADCRNCMRLAGTEAITNHVPVIDATKANWPDGVCPMRIPEAA